MLWRTHSRSFTAVFFLSLVLLVNAREFVMSQGEESGEAIAHSIATMPKVCPIVSPSACYGIFGVLQFFKIGYFEKTLLVFTHEPDGYL